MVEPLIQLKKFERVHLRKGESRQITWTLTAEDMEIVDASLQRIVYPGTFEVMVGAASNDIRLKGDYTINR